jgi:hypothetical protein
MSETSKRQMIVRYPEDWDRAQVDLLFKALDEFIHLGTLGLNGRVWLSGAAD